MADESSMLPGSAGNVHHMSTFGERLRQAMDAAGVSATELAKVLVNQEGRVGVTRQAVYLVLSGSSRAMSAENVARAARRLNVDTYWLATGEGQPQPPASTPAVRGNPVAGLGRQLAAVPEAVRPALAQTVSGWILEGGAAHYQAAVEAMLEAALSSPKRS